MGTTRDITIRRALAADAPGIARVHLASWQTAYRGILDDGFLDRLMDSYPQRLARWEHGLREPEPPGTLTLVAEQPDGVIVGFATAGPNRTPRPGHAGELHAIYLLAGQRGRGLGRRLFGACVRHLRELRLEGMLVLVLERNPACRFYEALGGTLLPDVRIDLTFGGTPVVEVAYGWSSLPEE